MFFTHFAFWPQSLPYSLPLGWADGVASPVSITNFLLPVIVVGFMYYFMVVKPEKATRDEHKSLLENLKKNDHVVTAGGIHGTVVNADQGNASVTIRIDENTNTKIHVQRTSIARVVTDADESEQKAS